MSTALADFLPEVLPSVSGCPEQVAKNGVRNAIIELCKRGLIWKYDLDPIPTQAKWPTYELTLPLSSQVIKPSRVAFEGEPIDPYSRARLDSEYAGWATRTGNTFGYFFNSSYSELTLAEAPGGSNGSGLEISMYLAPTRDATTVEDFIYDRLLEEVAFGARARLMMMKDSTWYDPKLGDWNRMQFDKACGAGSAEEAGEHADAPQRTTSYYSLG